MRTLRVGIASYEQMKARTIAIARGEYSRAPAEPKGWFTSAESFARVLSERNRVLLGIIAGSSPESLARRAEEIESVPNAEDHGAIRLRSSQPRSAGSSHPASSVPAHLVDTAVVKASAARDRGRMNSRAGF